MAYEILKGRTVIISGNKAYLDPKVIIDRDRFVKDGMIYERYQTADNATIDQEQREMDLREKYGENQ